MPMTRQPLSLPIWPATEPTAPAAPEITSTSPGFGRPTCSTPMYAVRPVIPSTPSAAAGDTPSGTGSRRAASSAAYSRQPSGPLTRAPGAYFAEREASTSPMPWPGMTLPMSVGSA